MQPGLCGVEVQKRYVISRSPAVVHVMKKSLFKIVADVAQSRMKNLSLEEKQVLDRWRVYVEAVAD